MEKDTVIKNYMKELCKKLERKIELNLGRRFELLNCEEVIDSYITWLRENNQYDNIITQDLRINKKGDKSGLRWIKNGDWPSPCNSR